MFANDALVCALIADTACTPIAPLIMLQWRGASYTLGTADATVFRVAYGAVKTLAVGTVLSAHCVPAVKAVALAAVVKPPPLNATVGTEV